MALALRVTSLALALKVMALALDYISLINDDDFDVDSQPLSKLTQRFPLLKPLLETMILCIPASTAPVYVYVKSLSGVGQVSVIEL